MLNISWSVQEKVKAAMRSFYTSVDDTGSQSVTCSSRRSIQAPNGDSRNDSEHNANYFVRARLSVFVPFGLCQTRRGGFGGLGDMAEDGGVAGHSLRLGRAQRCF